jgi:Protein of unknown function (DUF2587)
MDPNAPEKAAEDVPEADPAAQVMQAVPVDPGSAPGDRDTASQETITEPAKLLRIASMVRELLDETRQASIDEAGRKRLADVYSRSIDELSGVLSDNLRDELGELAPPLAGVPTESEIRIAQAQLVGWLEGLFHGIQAAMFAQQAAARQQFEELRRRGLPGQQMGGDEGSSQPDGTSRSGQYL